MRKYLLLISFVVIGIILSGCTTDKTKPVIHQNSSVSFTFEIFSEEPNWLDAVTVTDDNDGVISLTSDNVDATNVNLSEIGTYEVTYTVEDSSGNIATLIIPVYVVDETPPELNRVTELTYEVNDPEPDWLSLVTITDNYDENVELTLENVDLSEVDMSTVGTFNVTFTYTDSNENQSVPYVITVTIQDNDSPLLTLNGESDIYIGLGREYIDLGADFTDNYDDAYTLFSNQTVDTSIEGDYVITYTAIDTSENHAETITRTVHVIEDFSILLYDAGLEEAIRDELDKDEEPITQEDLESITYLDADDYDIVSLSGIEYLVNLRGLEIDDNYIFDLEPLSKLTNLEYLDLDDNYIFDLEPLSKLTNLEYLDLDDNLISDITPLSNLTNLKELDLDDNLLNDITPLSSLINLQELDLSDNQISDITPLLSLLEITHLELEDNNLTDISALRTMYDNGILSMYSRIDLDSNQLDLTEGSEAYNVITYVASKGVYIDIASTVFIDDYGNDYNSATLVEIDTFVDGEINYNGDLDWFKFELDEETELVIYTESSMATTGELGYLSVFYISNIESKYYGGEDFNFRMNITLQPGTYYLQINSESYYGAEEIAGSYRLYINKYVSEPSSPEVVFADSNLERVIRNELNIPIGPITQDDCDMIGSLQANYENISDLTGIEHLTNVTYLELNNNNITDLTPLQNLTNLKYLILDYNQISDISVLNNLTNLKLLELRDNNISDISVLQTLYDNGAFSSNLEGFNNEIRLDYNPIDMLEGSDAYNVVLYLKNNNVRLDLNYIFINDDHGNTYTDATNIQIGDSINGILDFDDRDWFMFTLVEETEVIIYTTSIIDTYGYLYDGNMNLIFDDDDNGGSNNFRIVELLPAGTYYLNVKGYDEEEKGHYGLHLESTT